MTARRSILTLGRMALLALLVALVGPALFSAADAKAPHGSVAEVILEPNLTGDPTQAIQHGWWGHGAGSSPTKTGTTYASLDLADATGKVTAASTAALGKLFGDKTLDNLRVAFVPYSADGSNERPRVTKDENAGEAFTWFTDVPFGAGWNGAEAENDSVATVSTLAEWTAWWQLGRPLEGYLNDLSVVTISNGGDTHPAAAPEGKSILNRWPAGEKISMVFYLSDGYDKTYPLIPRVAVGPDGRAVTAWLTFRTVAAPKDHARTSAGFDVLTYSPPSAYPGGGKSGAKSGSDPTSGHSSAADRSPSEASGSHASGPGSDSSWVSQVADAVPGGTPVLIVILVLLGAAVVITATNRLRSRDAASAAPIVTRGREDISDEVPMNERR